MIEMSELKQVLKYEPENGEFWWLVKLSPRASLSKQAGWVDGQGYRRISIHGKSYAAHRLAWFMTYGCWPVKEVDHINRKRSDNRLENLREASRSNNQCNKAVSKNSSSGLKGVYRSGKFWVARIKHKRKRYHLGIFDSREAAAAAYSLAAKRLHGEFAVARDAPLSDDAKSDIGALAERQRLGLTRRNKSGFRGVYWHVRNKRWVARIRLGGKPVHLGNFETAEAANDACLAAREKYA